MDSFGPALELFKSGSPYAAGLIFGWTSAWAAYRVIVTEIKRHHVAEITQWSERYAELKEDRNACRQADEEHTKLWLAAEQEKARLIQAPIQAAREAGG